MKFLVEIDVAMPKGHPENEALLQEEVRAGLRLLEEGSISLVCSTPKGLGNVGIWEAEDEPALRQILDSLPLRMYMDYVVTPLIPCGTSPDGGAESTRPPEFNTLAIEIDGEIVTLTLNRPDSFNAMSPEMLGELAGAMSWLADQNWMGALVITGAGRAFSPGGDVTWFEKGLEDPEVDLVAEVREGADRLHRAIIALERVPCPVVAAINGAAAGAGLSLALACDIRICSESASLVCAYGRIGASPDGGLTWFLPRMLGTGRAMEILLEDPDLSAWRALSLGLVSEVVSPEELVPRARETATRLAAKSPYYVKQVKELVHRSTDRTLAEHLDHEREGIAASMATADLKRAVAAFRAGESAEFRTRSAG
jgi:2-(1,2-epoxy-1,2-dihydrophenyl)acetyl-CoA isomerase